MNAIQATAENEQDAAARAAEMLHAPSTATGRATELKRSVFAPLIIFLYKVLKCHRRWRIARLLLNLVLRLEGPMHSATARFLLAKYHDVQIGAYTYGECFDPKIVPPGVTLGRYVSVAAGVRMFTQNHPLDRLSTHPFFYEAEPGVAASNDLQRGTLVVGSDVWLGANAIVTPGCRRIGNGAVIGAGAVVTKDVPDFAIVAGTPAKRIRDRFSPAVMARLLRAKWWELSEDEVRARQQEFTSLLMDDDSSAS